MSSKRDHKLDWLRVIAMTMIVLMHSPNPESNIPGYIQASMSYITAAGLVLFFMISGALLLSTRLSAEEFIKKRLFKIVWPTLFWTFFYLIIYRFVIAPTSWDTLSLCIASIPFSNQGHGVLWFMYTLAGLYLLAPILSRWLAKATKSEVEFYLLLWAITLTYPYLSLVLKIDESETGVLHYFTGYVGYFVFGYYLKCHYQFKVWHVVLAIGFAVLIPLLLYLSGSEFDFYRMLWYLSLPVALMAFSWYVVICRLPLKQCKLIEKASTLSFGVYLMHIFIMRDFIWKSDVIQALPALVELLVVVIVTMLISYFISWLISKLSFSKYIIGI